MWTTYLYTPLPYRGYGVNLMVSKLSKKATLNEQLQNFQAYVASIPDGLHLKAQLQGMDAWIERLNDCACNDDPSAGACSIAEAFDMTNDNENHLAEECHQLKMQVLALEPQAKKYQEAQESSTRWYNAWNEATARAMKAEQELAALKAQMKVA
jgi:DNA repair ATPase RecN